MNAAKLPPNAEIELFTFFPRFEGVHALTIEISVYFFGLQGEVIDGAPIRRGKAELTLSEQELHEGHILISPSSGADGMESLTLTAMRAGAVFESPLVWEPGKRAYTLPPVPQPLWQHWLISSRNRAKVARTGSEWVGILIW